MSDQSVHGTSSRQIPPEIYAQELVDVRARRGRLFGGNTGGRLPSPAETVAPSATHSLVGLALSGGGIRSATFNLGVLQARSQQGLLGHVDYLSTVSGGGYIGSSLSSIVNGSSTGGATKGQRPGVAWGANFPFAHVQGAEESAAIHQLRNFSNYLAPGGVFDTLRIPALLLRGMIVNLSVVLPAVVLAAVLMALAGPDISSFAAWPAWLRWAVPATLLAFAVAAIGSARIRPTNWDTRDFFQKLWAWALGAVVFIGALVLLPAIVVLYDRLEWGHLTAVGSVVVLLLPTLGAGMAAEQVATWRGKVALYVLGLLGPLALMLMYAHLARYLIQDPGRVFPAVWIASVLFLWNYVSFDANATSMLMFYRDRLSKAYLFRWWPQAAGNPPENDEQKLSGLVSHGPYHLINATLNLQGSTDLSLRGRNSERFTFSKYYCGSRRTGYCDTGQLGRHDPKVNLGTAMAIAAAAASPNMGTTTIPALVFIMTLLNVRLGYWLPNPRWVQEPGQWWRRRYEKGPGPAYLLREMWSGPNASRSYVNVSDGGHVENLGVYELLHRRCKFIIASDAEADPDHEFSSLARVIRFARIDWGFDIDIDLDDLAKDDDGLSLKSWALGKIQYSEHEVGYLLYIKASVTGNENEYLKTYRRGHPTFPHQSTADQFFDEAQFECYRALGYKVVRDLGELRSPDNYLNEYDPESISEWFAALRPPLRPRGPWEEVFVHLQEELSRLEREFDDRGVAVYCHEIYPERAAGAASLGPSDPDRVLHLCGQQLNFMEDAFIALGLDKRHNRDHPFNRGWMNLFSRWASAPSFRRNWIVLIGNHSPGFQYYCEDSLGLILDVRWTTVLPKDVPLHLPEDLLSTWGRAPEEDRGTEVWIASIGVTRTLNPVVVGFVSVETHGGIRVLQTYAVRSQYRKMDLLDRMVRSLRLEDPSVPLQVRADDEQMRLFGAFFDRLGLERWSGSK